MTRIKSSLTFVGQLARVLRKQSEMLLSSYFVPDSMLDTKQLRFSKTSSHSSVQKTTQGSPAVAASGLRVKVSIAAANRSVLSPALTCFSLSCDFFFCLFVVF